MFVWRFLAATVLMSPVALAEVNWSSMPYTPISTYQAVNENGGSAYTGGFPVRMYGVVLNHTEDWLDPTAAYDPGVHLWQMGGQAELIVQAVAEGDFGGVFCWIGQNYGNHIGKQDPIYSYTDQEFWEELDRLSFYGGPNVIDPIRAGALVEIRARMGLNYGGKMNVNENHSTSPANDFDILVLDADYGLPAAIPLTLDMIKDASDVAIFDPTRATGGERYQTTRVNLKGVQVIEDGVNPFEWGSNHTLTVQDRSGRTLKIYLGLNEGFDAMDMPVGYFNVEGIVDQSSSTGRDGYRLLVLDPSGVLPQIPGDYNEDGVVDLADYTVWADHYGQTGVGIAGDGNEDGVVDLADYTVWADHFGQGQ